MLLPKILFFQRLTFGCIVRGCGEVKDQHLICLYDLQMSTKEWAAYLRGALDVDQ